MFQELMQTAGRWIDISIEWNFSHWYLSLPMLAFIIWLILNFIPREGEGIK